MSHLARAAAVLGVVSLLGAAFGLIVTQAIVTADYERKVRGQLVELAEAYQRDTGQPPPIEVSVPLPEVEGGEDGADGEDGRDGRDGRPPTEAEIAAAVLRFCAANDGCRGPQGEPGADGSNGRDGVSIAGTPGIDGHDGAPGPSCPTGYRLAPLPAPLAGWLACAPEVAGG